MDTFSNELTASVFFSGPDIEITGVVSPSIEWELLSSPSVEILTHEPVRTPNPSQLDSLTVLSVHKDTELEGWRLKSVLVVELRHTDGQYMATTWLEKTAEYGISATAPEAITDLIISLGEYLESLETREEDLGDSAKLELNFLRNLIENASAN